MNREKMTVEYEDRREKDKNGSLKDMRNIRDRISEIGIDLIKAKKQCRVDIHGIEVYFPYPPYTNQLVYMEKVIEACRTGNLAALESPTGTGKTLCLLCASLGWLRAKRSQMREQISSMSSEEAEEFATNVPFIYYSSRTHSQLANVMKELKKTCYMPRTATMSSRDQMCVNAAVKQYSGNMLNMKCKQVRVRKECKYFFGSEKLSLGAYDNTDIEELYLIGQKSGFCPFFFQRNKKEIADVLFLPYNYIFESKFRKVLKIELKNAIVLIDEAHNMEMVCENSKSFEFSIKMIDECLSDLKQIKIVLENSDTALGKESVLKSIDPKRVKDEESILTSIKSYLKSFSVKTGSNWPNFGMKLSPKEFFDIFFEGSKRNDKSQTLLISDKNIRDDSNSKITPENLKSHVELLKKIESGIVDELQKTSIISNWADILDLVSTLSDNYLTFVKSKDTNPTNCSVNNFKVFMNDVEEFNPQANNKNFPQYSNKNSSNANTKIRTLFLYCFNPGFGFKDVITSGAQTVIITSGTLSPIESMETELKCNFKIKLENKHVIDKCQVNFSILTNSFKSKIPFRFDANNRNNSAMLEELGLTISDLCKVTPGGILVFFTAYHFMNTCINAWAEKEILSEIEKSKEIFKDASDSNKNKIVLSSFKETCLASSDGPSYKKPKKGGILFSVCRGTSSEGIDFTDDMARMVIIVGIPYPNLGDVKVNLKKEYLDEFNSKYFSHVDKSINIKKLTSGEWYTQSATKAVNQALGRVIRHIDDYGSMILIDGRYKELLYKKVFSAWLIDNAKVHEDSRLLIETKNFYDAMKNYVTEKKQKRKEIKSSNDDNKESVMGVNQTNNKALIVIGNTNNSSNSNNIITSINSNNTNSSYNSNNLTTSSLNKSMNTHSNLNTSIIKYSNNDNVDPKKNIKERIEYKEECETNVNESNTNNLFKRGKKIETNTNVGISSNINNAGNSSNTNFKPNSNSNSILNFNTNSNNTSNSSLNTSSLIDDIKTKLDSMTRINKDINLDMKNISKVTANTINININQSSSYPFNLSNYNNVKKAAVTYTELNTKIGLENKCCTPSNSNLSNCNYNNIIINNNARNSPYVLNTDLNKLVEEDIFDSLNQDELMDIINQNISYFEDDQVNALDPAGQIKMTPRLSTSKKKVYRQGPASLSESQITQDNNGNNNLAPNNLFNQFTELTPIKTSTGVKEEIKSEVIVKKLLELKERAQLEHLLEKYNLKMCFDSQTNIEENVKKEKEIHEVEENNNSKRIECPICFDSINKYFFNIYQIFRKFSAAKCGHILCKECWDKCLENKLECPMCKKKVRPSTLVNIFL